MKKLRPLTKKETSILEKSLADEREKFIFNNVQVSEEFNTSRDDMFDQIDQANADADQAKRLRFRNREVFYCKKIEEALTRIKRNEYGYCEECDLPIGFQRLRARPTADKCIIC